MSHGHVFVDGSKTKDNDENKVTNPPKDYFISDTAVIVSEINEGGTQKYHVLGIDDAINTVAQNGKVCVRLWLDNNDNCEIILIEL